MYSLVRDLDSLRIRRYFQVKASSGRCQKTISECLSDYYQSVYGPIANLYIERLSQDTVGDAVYSHEVITKLEHSPDVAIITS